MLDKGIVLLCRSLCQRLEPVSIVCDTILVGPLLHACCHCIGNAAVELCTVVDNINKFVIHFRRKIFVHLLTVEHFLTEEF